MGGGRGDHRRRDRHHESGHPATVRRVRRTAARPALPKADELDRIFGDRIAVITDNSGHGAYFTTALIKRNGWDVTAPPDPVGGHFGRNPDGSLNGQAFETPAIMSIAAPVMAQIGGNPLASAAQYYAWMARGGYTSTSDMTYDRAIKPAYEALAAAPSCPLRISMWEMSTSQGFADPESFAAGEALLVKRGVKLWTDGSPWIGNIAISFPYLSNDTTRDAGIDPAVAGGVGSMNYTREQLDATLDQAAPAGWQMSFHANGDLAIDLALDAYEAALHRHNLIGTDHRWRLEHLGPVPGRSSSGPPLGVYVSMAPFQYYFWGDLLDGKLFDHEHGSRWQAFGDAVAAGAVVSLHNDGSVSPPTPLLNIQTAVSRRTRAGTVHGPEQAISLDAALRAHTIDAARTLHREDLVGSISVGKLADFTELTGDPYTVEPAALAEQVQVSGTWLSGKRIDLEAFLGAVNGIDTDAHAHLNDTAHRTCC